MRNSAESIIHAYDYQVISNSSYMWNSNSCLTIVSLGRVHLFNSNTGILLIWQFTLSNVVGITDPVSDVGTTFDAEVVKNI